MQSDRGNGKKLFEAVSLENPATNKFHPLLMQFVRDYFLIGGMPAAVNAYIKTRSYVEPMRVQKALLDIYRLDLAKYGRKKEFAHLQRLFEKCPDLVAKHFRYSKIDPESRILQGNTKTRLRKLHQAGTCFSHSCNSC